MLSKRRPLFFLRLFLPIAILLLTGVLLYGRSEIKQETTRLGDLEKLNVALGTQALNGSLEELSRDLDFLVSYSALHLAVDKPTPENLAHLAQDWANFSRSQRVYDQLRWLDETGMEVVRVDYVKGQPRVAPAAELQNKAARYFFRDAFKLNAGQVYVSPLDLNIEHDQIEMPYKPTLRVATPIFDTARKKRGILILNYYGNVLLQALTPADTTMADHMMLLNRDGYWLKSPNPADEWGFMFKRSDLTLGKRAPQAWAHIRDEDRGQTTLDDGLWTWQSVYPLADGQTSSTGASDVFAPSRAEVDSRQYVWKNVAHLPTAALTAVTQAVWLKLSGVALVLLGLLGLGTWKLTQAWAKQAAAEDELRGVNTDLEQIVAERTQALTRANEDLTRQQQALLESEKQFRGLVEQSLIGIYLSDGASVHYINPRAEEILGYEPGGLAGESLTPLVTDEDRPLVVRQIRRLVKGEINVLKMDFRVRRKDNSEVTIGTQILRTSVDGRPAVIGVMQDITEKKHAEEEIKRYIAEIETAFMSTVQVTTTLSELRDPYTAGHERRVGEIAVAIGAELGFDARRQEGLRVAGYLHDIGKISIPAEILSKPGKLSPIEFQLIQNHPQSGYDVLKDVKFPWPVAQVALQHHERMDGSGYPQGLKSEAILFEARIVAVADVVEAMSSHRPYRPGLGLEAALAEIKRGRTSAYDPQVVDACLKLFREKGYALP